MAVYRAEAVKITPDLTTCSQHYAAALRTVFIIRDGGSPAWAVKITPDLTTYGQYDG
jgi:hypothetical protein